MSEILTSIAQPMRYLIELDTPLVLKKNIGMLMEGDVEANTVALDVFKTRDVPADLSGITINLYLTRPDGNTLQPIAGTVEGNTVRMTLTGGCYKYTGQYTMLVTMKKGEENRTVLKATGHMEGRNTENMIDPEGTFPTPEELLEMLNVLDEALQSANTATENATAAAKRANNAAAGIETVTATATELEPNEEATAQVIKGESGMHFAFGIPRGEKGEKGDKGDAGTAENVTIESIAGLSEALNSKQPKGDYLPADGTAEDASKLGGKLPEEYLPADGTAADASKLGGVAAAEYATKENLKQYATKEDLENIDIPAGGANVAYNLLDNSNLEIAQAGYNGLHGSQRYAADRWISSEDSTFTIAGEVKTYTSNNGYCFLLQKLWNDGRDKGKTYTLGIELDDGSIVACTATSPTSNVTEQTVLAMTDLGGNKYIMIIKEANGDFCARLNLHATGESVAFKHLLMVEGAYTAETLPKYVPKGYAAELAECQRYFLKPSLDYCFFYYLNYNKTAYFAGTMHFPIEMRIVPTVTILNVRISGISEGSINPSQFTITHIKKSGLDTIYFPYESELKQAIPLFALVEANADL